MNPSQGLQHRPKEPLTYVLAYIPRVLGQSANKYARNPFVAGTACAILPVDFLSVRKISPARSNQVEISAADLFGTLDVTELQLEEQSV